MSKLILKAEALQFPVDKEFCELSEVLKREYFERETTGDFSVPHELPISKSALPSLIAFMTATKIAKVEIKRSGEVPTLEDTNSGFQKLVKDLELDSPGFQQLMTLQNTYKIHMLSEQIGYFVYIKTRQQKDETLCKTLGLTYDGDQLDSRLKKLIANQVSKYQ